MRLRSLGPNSNNNTTRSLLSTFYFMEKDTMAYKLSGY